MCVCVCVCVIVCDCIFNPVVHSYNSAFVFLADGAIIVMMMWRDSRNIINNETP